MYERLLEKRQVPTRYRSSETVVDGDVARMKLAGGAVTLYDARFVDAVGGWAWHSNGVGYARNGSGAGIIYLHRFVLWLAGVPFDAEQVDHINNDRLDNRLGNLRLVTRSQNQCNRPLVRNRKYRGVTLDKGRGKYAAVIRRQNKQIHLGRFDNEIDAAKAYDRAAIAHGGVYRLNFEE
jgi:hypothetical protein